MPPLAFNSALRAFGIGGIEGLTRPGCERRFAFFGVNIGHERGLAIHGARERQPHQTDAAKTDQ